MFSIIKITGARKDDDSIRVEVIDNGAGMTEEQVSSLNEKLNSAKTDGAMLIQGDKGFGIMNVNNRIRLNFGDKYGLYYVSKKDTGTRVEVTIPYLTKQGVENV